MHTPVACGQWSVYDHNDDKQSVFLGKDMGFGVLCMVNSKSGDYSLFNSGYMLEFLWWPHYFHEIEIDAMYSYIPLGLNQLRNVGVDQWLHVCIVDTCQWVYILVEGLFWGLFS